MTTHHHTTTTTTTTTRRRGGLFGRRKPVHHQKRKATLGDKIAGGLKKLKGTILRNPGEKVGNRASNSIPPYSTFSCFSSSSSLPTPTLKVCIPFCVAQTDLTTPPSRPRVLVACTAPMAGAATATSPCDDWQEVLRSYKHCTIHVVCFYVHEARGAHNVGMAANPLGTGCNDTIPL